MKKLLLGTVALVALGAAVPALAADLPARTYTKAPAYAPAPIYNWTGFYIGGHIGGAFAGNNNLASNNGQFLGGVQGGADYQFAPNWVLGVEAQYSWLGTNSNSLTLPGGTLVSTSSEQLGSVTGRLGYTWGAPVLLYVKGGYAWRDGGNIGANVPFTATGNSRDGYTVGAGLEYLFAPNWSAKIEYQYYNFGDTNFISALDSGSFHNEEHTVKAGLNYRFNWGGPVVAKY
jgi:outer membrane immunogenic protein